MNSRRWTYQVVELKSTFWGRTRQRLQDTLSQLGLQGWELVSAVVPAGGADPEEGNVRRARPSFDTARWRPS